MKFFITGSLFLAIIAIGFGIQQNITEPQGQEYISRVKLKTDCEVDPSSFAMLLAPDGSPCLWILGFDMMLADVLATRAPPLDQ